MHKQFGFVVLNYKNHEETRACVESILTISGSNYFIVVVDNDSPNRSYEVLCKEFTGIDKVKVLASGRNGGYSYGNNCGIAYLQSMGIHDIIIATSDTVVLSKDILEQLESIDTADVGIVGPRVVTPDDLDQNPMLWKIGLDYFLNIHFPAVTTLCRNLIYTVAPSFKRSIGNMKNSLRQTSPGGFVYMVHGCFLYLTSTYLNKCGKLDESLFMYGEEDLLSYNCLQNKLKVLYHPDIQVLHKDAMSTPKENGNSFTLTNSRVAMKYLKSKLKKSSLLVAAFKS